MSTSGIGRRRFLAQCGGLIAGGLSAGLARADARPLRFGLTPVFLNNDLELLGRLRDYLATACEAPLQLVTRRTYQEITALLVSGQLDAAWICGYPFVVFRKELELVAVPVWQGRQEYQSYLIGRADRHFAAIGDLQGDVHAYSDPDSNSGYLVTAAALVEARFEPSTFFRRSFFTYGHRNVIRAVASGLAQSGSVDGYVYEVVARLEPALTAGLRVLRRSEWLGFPPIAAPVREPVPGRTAMLRRALERMDRADTGRAVLSLLQLDGFNAGNPALFDGIGRKIAMLAKGAVP
ncbi:PhnD/SsuA/transferrin family substrate-binding protein [Rhabdaerophilum calidifontis]|uniref:substrate-binding domain-containing protein n=1 Tax=Rhabdaerophilum calidifontis TaxID=2604328 RepID=UPI001239B072|nr:PhnD/SsuA/transferrin family substrate-binding protein [Rhabdaerophilum calidifontis]